VDRRTHSFSNGRPKDHVFQTVSTERLPPAERYAFWAEDVIRTFAIPPPDGRQQRDFVASVTSLANPSGEMHHAVGDAYEAHLSARAAASAAFDELSLFLMLEGRALYAYGDGPEREVPEGGFFLLDGSRPMSVRFTRHSCIQVDLSRPLLESLFPGGTPDPDLITEALAHSRLAGLLRDHLRRFPDIASGMAPPEQLALLDASESFALTTIEGAFSTAAGPSAHSREGMFAAAQRYIRRNLANPDLDPAAVAGAVGCSRSTLYRLFAEHDLTVGGYVRELRLQQFMHLLRKDDGTAPIHALAQRCGFHDTPNVNRVFRRRFGMSPSEARAQRREEGGGDGCELSSAS